MLCSICHAELVMIACDRQNQVLGCPSLISASSVIKCNLLFYITHPLESAIAHRKWSFWHSEQSVFQEVEYGLVVLLLITGQIRTLFWIRTWSRMHHRPSTTIRLEIQWFKTLEHWRCLALFASLWGGLRNLNCMRACNFGELSCYTNLSTGSKYWICNHVLPSTIR